MIKLAIIIALTLIILVLLIWRRARTKIIRRQDMDILKLNMTIIEKDEFITELIKKYGLVEKDKLKFKQKLDKAFRDKRLNGK